jgi:pimeloyl-ACP methyl ester carboxylesterase
MQTTRARAAFGRIRGVLRHHLRGAAALTSALTLALVLSVTLVPAAASDRQSAPKPKPTIVLVHGAWADGSSWNEVTSRLQAEGYTVDVPPNTLRGPSEDSAYLSSYLATISGPIVLVGHSYGGFVITNAATGNAAVKALVYVDAFIPAQGDTLLGLTTGSCLSGDPTTIFNVVPFTGGEDLYIKTAADGSFPGFDQCFANGVPAKQAAELAASQRPLSAAALSEPSGAPAWASIPSWSVVGTEDHVITPAEQLLMSTRADAHITKVAAGHLSMITQPAVVTNVIEQAANAS